MKIGIIGVGNVGSVLGKKLSTLGHEVFYGVRNTQNEKVQNLLKGSSAKAGSAEEAIKFADVILLAIPWDAAEAVVKLARDNKDKIIIDCTNPLLYNKGFKELAVGNTNSAAETIATWAGSTPVVKAFNTTGSANMANPVINDIKVTMYVAGDDNVAKAKVLELVNTLGFAGFDAGPLYVSRFLESMASLWVHTAYVLGKGPDFAFNVITR